MRVENHILLSSRFLGSELRGNKHMTARVVEKSLLVIALLLLGSYVMARIYHSVLSRVEVWRFASQERVDQPGLEPTHRLIWPAQEETNPNLWSPGRVMAFWESLSRQFAPPIGVLRVPKINLEVAVLEGTDEWTLNRAVGRIIGTARMGEQGNVGIAGHRDGFFRGLKELQVGDTLHLVTPEKTEIYTVDRILIVDPQAVHLLGPRPEPSITLVTCYPFYYVGSAPERYVVQGLLKNSPTTQETDVSMDEVQPKEET